MPVSRPAERDERMPGALVAAMEVGFLKVLGPTGVGGYALQVYHSQLLVKASGEPSTLVREDQFDGIPVTSADGFPDIQHCWL